MLSRDTPKTVAPAFASLCSGHETAPPVATRGIVLGVKIKYDDVADVSCVGNFTAGGGG
jgi:hypothetical protein